MAQTWDDLLFAHWRVSPEALRPLVPAALEIDLFQDHAWLGVVPFRLTGLRLRGMLPLPRFSTFPEINVRTYVTHEDKPGVWFFSLDADSRLAVELAPRMYRLPYFRARMSVTRSGEFVEYTSTRIGSHRPFAFSGPCRPIGSVFASAAGSPEHFLTDRYCLYAAHGGQLFRAEIHHRPWPLQRAEAAIELNTMAPDGIDLPGEEPLLHFSARQDAIFWPLEPLEP
jgi:uncharacterized protein YqjF (DUF2071 family)